MAFRVPFKVLHFSSDRLIIFRKHILKSLREHLVNVDGETLGILRISVGDVYRFYHVFMQYNQYICLNEAPSH